MHATKEHTCSRADQGSSFSFISSKTVAVANRARGTIDLIPLSASSTDHIHRLEIPPSHLPTVPTALSLSVSSRRSSEAVLFKFGAPFGQQQYLIIAREHLRRFSAEYPPSFPDLSTSSMAGGHVSVSWSQWGKYAEVYSTQTLQSDMFMLDGSWFVMKTPSQTGNQFVVRDQISHRKILDVVLDYQDIIVQSDSGRILGLRVSVFCLFVLSSGLTDSQSFEHGAGDRTLQSIDVYQLR